ncbi:MAG: hypothetical protein U5K51_14160 [Flavobacteriaceae bacterium]|nr:hypothetical protein [Flavobacteriaceae bacterium]
MKKVNYAYIILFIGIILSILNINDLAFGTFEKKDQFLELFQIFY